MSVATGLHISIAPSKQRSSAKQGGKHYHDPQQVAYGAEECVRVDDSGKRVFVGRGEVSFAHRQCTLFDFDHIGVSPQHSSTFLQLVAPMVFDFVESALPIVNSEELANNSSQAAHPRGWSLDSPRRRSSFSSRASNLETSSYSTSHHSSNTVIVYGHSNTDRRDLHRYLVEHIADAASNQVRSKNQKHAHQHGHSTTPSEATELLELSFSLVDAYHAWGIADVLDLNSFLHDVNGTRTLNAMKRSNGSKGLPFVMPTKKPLGRTSQSIHDDVADVASAVQLLRGLKILYRQAEVADHKQSSSSVMSFFCASRQRSAVLHVVLLPEADAASSLNRIGTQLSAVSTTLQHLHQLPHDVSSTSFGQGLPGLDTSSVQTQSAQTTRVPMRESPVLMYLMQTEDYYQNERAARHLVAAHNRMLDDELARVNSDASFSRKHIPSTTPRRQPPIAQVVGTPSSHGFPALPSVSLAHSALGNVALVIAVNCAVENYAHVLSACHFARRARPHHRTSQNQAPWQQGDVSTTSLLGPAFGGVSSKGSSPGRYEHLATQELVAFQRNVKRSPRDDVRLDHDDSLRSPKDPFSATQAQPHHRDQSHKYSSRADEHTRHHAHRIQHDDGVELEYAVHQDSDEVPAFASSHEPSSIEHSRVVASRDATIMESSAFDEMSHKRRAVVEDDDETSVERTYRQVIHSAAAVNVVESTVTALTTTTITSAHHHHHNAQSRVDVPLNATTPEASPRRPLRSHDASTMVLLSPASPASTQTDSLLLAHPSAHTASQSVTGSSGAPVTTSSQTTTAPTPAASTVDERTLFPSNAIPANKTSTTPGAVEDADDDDFEALARNIAAMGDMLERNSAAAVASPGDSHTAAATKRRDSNASSTATPRGTTASSSLRFDESRGDGAVSSTSHSLRYGAGRLESPQFDFDIPELDDFMSRSQSAARGGQQQVADRDTVNSKGGAWSSKSSVVSSKQLERHEELPSESGDGDEEEVVKSILMGTRTSPSPRQPTSKATRSGERSDAPVHSSKEMQQYVHPHGAPLVSTMSSYPMIVERLTYERDALSAQVKRLERELSLCHATNEELRGALVERQDHARRLSSKLEDLANQRQFVADELVTSHGVQQKFFKDQLDDAVSRHEASAHSLQQTILALSRDKMLLERELVQLKEHAMNQSNQTLATETLQSHINVLHSQIETLNAQHAKDTEEVANDAKQWKRKAEGLLQELSHCRSSQHEHEVALELRKTEEKMKLELLVERKIRDAVQHQASTLDAERRARQAAEHEAFQLRLQVQALNSRLVFFEEQVAPEVDLSIKELEEQMHKMHEHRTRFQRTLHSTMTRNSVSSTTSPARGGGHDGELSHRELD